MASLVDASPSGEGGSRVADLKAWLSSQFEAAGKEVPEFELTPTSVAHLQAIASASQARTRAATIVAADLRQKAAEYRSQAARIREILESVGLARENLSPSSVASTQVLANVANLLNIRDTEMSSFLVAIADISLRKTDVEEKRSKVQKESKVLLEYTRKAIARLTFLKRTLAQLEDGMANYEDDMRQWQTRISIMESKERQYVQQHSNYKAHPLQPPISSDEIVLKNCWAVQHCFPLSIHIGIKGFDYPIVLIDLNQAMLKRVGYMPEISHGVLMEMAEHKKDLERKTKPIQDTLRNYQDLPPDKALAALAIEDKRRQYAAAEKYLEEVLQTALNPTE